MAKKRNFFLGHGERLTAPVLMPGKPVSRDLPYTFAEAQSRVLPMLKRAVAEMDTLPAGACPKNETVAALTLHPEYIAKSYYPATLMRSIGIRSVGSHGDTIKPKQRSRGREPVEAVTTRLFVAGSRSVFRGWAQELPEWSAQVRGAIELAAVEKFMALTPEEKLKPIQSLDDEVAVEAVLHASKSKRDAYIVDGFAAFLGDMDIAPDLDRRLYTGGLCFMALLVPRERIEEIARFSFLRIVRELPRLRVPATIVRTRRKPIPAGELPVQAALNQDLRVAVFDGGLPNRTPLRAWVRETAPPGVGPSLPLFQWHGHAVTSALLFGSLQAGAGPPRPFSDVQHFRVVDSHSANDRFELYDVLNRIKEVLAKNQFEFVNFSLGPDVP
jgi:hypothetical protein